MFVAALFMIVKLWRQPMYPSINEYIMKMWHIHSMHYYLVANENEIVSLAVKWVKLYIIMLSEISQPQKEKYFTFSFIGRI
jgi:hypothetical protein